MVITALNPSCLGHVKPLYAQPPTRQLAGGVEQLLWFGCYRTPETQGAFLFAPVEIIETYALVGHDAKQAERLIHAALRSFHVPLQVVGPDGRKFNATEWFRSDVETIAAVVEKSFSRSRKRAVIGRAKEESRA